MGLSEIAQNHIDLIQNKADEKAKIEAIFYEIPRVTLVKVKDAMGVYEYCENLRNNKHNNEQFNFAVFSMWEAGSDEWTDALLQFYPRSIKSAVDMIRDRVSKSDIILDKE